MKLVPFSAFPLQERDALQAALGRLHIPLQHVCISRVQPVPGSDDPALPTVVLVSAPGWTRTYEGGDWIAALERDLAAQRSHPHAQREGTPSGPSPLAAD